MTDYPWWVRDFGPRRDAWREAVELIADQLSRQHEHGSECDGMLTCSAPSRDWLLRRADRYLKMLATPGAVVAVVP